MLRILLVYGAAVLALLQGTALMRSFEPLAREPVALKPALVGVHPRVFVTAAELRVYRERAKMSDAWRTVLRELPAMKGDPPPPPGPQERRSQNDAAFAIAGASLAYAIEQQPAYLAAAKKWTLAAIDYEPWGYTTNKPNTDLAAGHLLYAIGWAYDLLFNDLSAAERTKIRASLERHATLVYDAFAPTPRGRFHFTQNHNFIPTAGLAVTALALMGESADAGKWASLARAHHAMANRLLSSDGYYYEGMEYWIFSIPWLVHFYDAWEHCTGENMWEAGPARNWKLYLAHTLLPDGQQVFDFGDIWEGALTRAGKGAEYPRAYPGGRLQSNFNVMYRVAARLKDPESEAVAERYASFGHSNLEEYWTLLWRDPTVAPAPFDRFPLTHHFEDMGVVYSRTSWDAAATAFAFKAGPPEGHRAARLYGTVPEWTLDSGHSHPDNGSFIVWADGRYLTGDTGYAGQPQARHHNTITVGGIGQGVEGDHDVFRTLKPANLDAIRITSVGAQAGAVRIEADLAAAYPASAGLTRFHRAFAFTPPGSFSIDDQIEAMEAQPVQWYLHADEAIETTSDGFVIPGRRPLIIEAKGPIARSRIEPTILTAPGQPGAITRGPQDRRGVQLVLETPSAAGTRISVRLRLQDPATRQ